MIEHKIVHGLSTIYKKEAGHGDSLPSSHAAGIMEYLVSTPAVLTMIIEASSNLLDPLLPTGYVTVGKKIELTHERPTLIGETITIILTVTKVEGDNIFLEIAGHDEMGLICKGIYERTIVDKERLIETAYGRSKHSLL